MRRDRCRGGSWGRTRREICWRAVGRMRRRGIVKLRASLRVSAWRSPACVRNAISLPPTSGGTIVIIRGGGRGEQVESRFAMLFSFGSLTTCRPYLTIIPGCGRCRRVLPHTPHDAIEDRALVR